MNEYFQDALAYSNNIGKTPKGWRSAMIDVIGTADFCKEWLDKHYKNSYTPTDLITMTKLIINQQNHYEWWDKDRGDGSES